MNKNNLLPIVIILNLAITVLTFVLGCLMYTSNSKSVQKNLTYVEITGFISNVEYGLHFGKSLDSYYGMEDMMQEVVASSPDIERMYIVNNSNSIVFETTEDVHDFSVLSLSDGASKVSGDELFCSFSLPEDTRLITVSEISEKTAEWKKYYGFLAGVAVSGFAATSLLMALIWKYVSDRKRAYWILIVILVCFIVFISSFVGYGAYSEYQKSMNVMFETIENAIDSDISKVHESGISDENIIDIEGYLQRYADNIPEIESVERGESGVCDFTISSSYIFRVKIDYALQTLLFLAFSAIILAEYQIFMSSINSAGAEGRNDGI